MTAVKYSNDKERRLITDLRSRAMQRATDMLHPKEFLEWRAAEAIENLRIENQQLMRKFRVLGLFLQRQKRTINRLDLEFAPVKKVEFPTNAREMSAHNKKV